MFMSYSEDTTNTHRNLATDLPFEPLGFMLMELTLNY